MPLVFCLLCTLLIPSALLAGEADSTSKQDGKRPRDFVLTVQGPLLSLRAQEASLTAILAAIGREMAIEVVAYIPAHERITVQFDQLSLAEALQRLHTNYVYVTEGTKVVKLLVLPRGAARVGAPERRPAAASGQEAPPPAPFRFEFDPSQRLEGRK